MKRCTFDQSVAAFCILLCPVSLLEVQCFHAFEHDIPSPCAITSLNHQCKFVITRLHFLRGKFLLLEGGNGKFALENADVFNKTLYVEMFYVSMDWVDFNRNLSDFFKAAVVTHTSTFLSLGDLEAFCKVVL